MSHNQDVDTEVFVSPVIAYQLLKRVCEQQGVDLQSFLDVQREIDEEENVA